MIKNTRFLLLAFLLFFSVHSRVLEITSHNIEMVIRSVGELYLFLNNPDCPQSKQYEDKFLNIKDIVNLGITDCTQQKELCSFLNVTHFPTVLYMTNSTVSELDQQELLVRESLIEKHNPKAVLNRLVKRIFDSQWAMVVLEEEGLPPIDKVEDNEEKGVFYISNPSKVHQTLLNMHADILGCWIMEKKGDIMKKYYCGNGYKSSQIQKHIISYKAGKLSPHIFNKQAKKGYIPSADLNHLVKQYRADRDVCTLVYFYSKNCEHCDLKDVEVISKVVEKANYQKKFQVKVFDIGLEELPGTIAIKRVPELIEFCFGRIEYFEKMFTYQEILRFHSRARQETNNDPNPSNEL